ncbi:MAG: pilus assembly FimT family protein [Pontibacterium sp.]
MDRAARNRGFNLAELLVVISIISMISLVATSSLSGNNSHKLNLAADEVATAIRFARSEAMRTGHAHGIKASAGVQQFQLYWLDTSGFPTQVYDVRHPADKKLYALHFGNGPGLQDIDLASVYIKFENIFLPVEFLGFDASGRPKYDTGWSIHDLETATLTLSYQGELRTIHITPVSGRVRVQ